MTDTAPPPHKHRRPAWHRWVLHGLYLPLGLVAAGVGLGFWVDSGVGRLWLARTLSTALDSPAADIEVKAISGHPLGRMTLKGVSIKDADGVWFKADALTLDWRPLALVRGTLAVTSLEGDGLQLLSLPSGMAGEAEAQASEGGKGGLPVAVQLDSLALKFRYGDAATLYQLKGAGLALNGSHLTGRVGLESARGDDRLQALVDWQAAARTLAVDMQLNAAPDGLLGTLIGLQDLGPLSADLKGDGALKAWKGSFHVKAGAAFAGEGTVTGEESGVGGGRLELAANLSHALALRPELAGLLGPHMTVKANLDFGVSGAAALTVDAESGATRAHLSGPLAGDGSVKDGTLSLTTPLYATGAALGGLRAENAALEGHFTLAWPALRASYTLGATRMASYGATGRDFKASGTVEMDQYHIGGTFDGLSLAGLHYGQAGRTWDTVLENGSGTWDVRRTDRAWRVDNITLKTPLVVLDRLKAGGTPEGGLGDLTLKASVTPAFLGTVAPGLVTQGETEVRLTASASDTGSMLGVDYAVAGHDIGWQSADLGGLVGAAPQLVGHVNLYPDGRIEDGTLRLAGQYVSGAAGNFRLAKGAVKGDFSIDVQGDAPRLAASAFALPTGLQIAGEVSGPFDAPTLDIRSELTSVTGYGLTLEEVKAALKLAPAPKGVGGWRGALQMNAATGAGPVTLGFDVSLADGAAHLGKIAFKSPVMAADGQVVWSAADGLDAMMSATMVPVKAPGFALSGTGSAILALSGKPGAMAGHLDLMARNWALALLGRFPVQVKALHGRIGLGGDNAGYGVDLALDELHYGAQQVETLTLKGDTGTDAGLKLVAEGYFGNGFKADATVKPSDGQARADFTVDYGGLEAKSLDPVTLGWDHGLMVKAPSIGIGDGTATLNARFDEKGLDASASLKAVPLSAVNTVRAGVFKAGVVDADLRFHHAAEEGEGSDEAYVRADLSGVRFFTDTLIGSDDVYSLKASGALKKGIVTLDAGAALAGKPVGTVTGSVPVMRASPGFYAIRAGAPLEMAVNWHGDVAPLWLLAGRPDHLLEGTLKGTLTLKGDLEHPVFTGSLGLEDGRYEYETLGLVAQDLKMELVGDNRAVALKSLTATDGNGGSMSGHGSFELSSKLSFPGTLAVSLKDYHMARLDVLDGTASAELSYVRGGAGGSLGGTVTTGTINFLLPKELPQSVVDIDVTEVGSPEETEAAAAVQLAKRKPTDLDVKVSVPGHLFVRGRGLESEWGGDLHIGGTTAVPRLTGGMTLRTGTFMLGGREFTIDSGSLIFRGGRRIDPEISVSATYRTTGLEAVLKIDGPVSAPKFTLTSTPALAEDEVLARVLFGRSVADLTPLQIAEVAVALNGLRGSNALDVVGQLRRQLGLDRLSITSDEDDQAGGALLTGGKYLRDNIYLEVETSTATSQAAARLRVNITRRFLAESEVGPRRGSSLKIKWFWEY